MQPTTWNKQEKNLSDLHIQTHEMMMQQNKQALVLDLDLHLNNIASQHTTQFILVEILE
jgi:hypothetical protein